MSVEPQQKVDFDYIFDHFDETKYEIPFYYDKQEWKEGETYRMRIAHIYDPSKFWIVVKETELHIFQKFLFDFYTKNGDLYKITENTACKNIYCVVYEEDAYYRGVIVNIPPSTSIKKKAWVFLFDFGYVAAIEFSNLYYLYEKMYQVPRFAVRATLSHVQPYEKPIWENNVVKRFNELTSGKVLLFILDCTNPSRKVVFISIGDPQKDSTVTDIGDKLINEKLAQSITGRSFRNMPQENSRYVYKTNYPYLFPSFEAIETGMVPSCVYTAELLKQCSVKYGFKPYFAYKGGAGN